jgi:hypothetical protein
MDFEQKTLNLNILSNTNLALSLYSLILFTLPILIPNQLILGTIVNALLIRVALTRKEKRFYLLAALPSTSALLTGILFASASTMLFAMIPFIIVGNLVLMKIFKIFFVKQRKNYALVSIFGALLKSALLFASALILIQFSLVPLAFATTFGVMQFITATLGATVNYFFKK